jgi:hypothetical protein
VQALAGVADQRGEALFDVEVHVFRSSDHSNLPARFRGDCAMPRSMSARSAALMMPCLASIRAWASEPRMSWRHMRWSKSTEAV